MEAVSIAKSSAPRPYGAYGGRYSRPYAPYFYGNSVYLVPGLLNSYWDYPDDFGANDGTPYFNQQPIQDNNYFQPDPC
jgi:hypothetical protein